MKRIRKENKFENNQQKSEFMEKYVISVWLDK